MTKKRVGGRHTGNISEPETRETEFLIEIRNFPRFQRYKRARPRWLKLYARELIENPDYARMPDAAWRLGIELIGLYADQDDPSPKRLRTSLDGLSFRLRREIEWSSIQSLQKARFLNLKPVKVSTIRAKSEPRGRDRGDIATGVEQVVGDSQVDQTVGGRTASRPEPPTLFADMPERPRNPKRKQVGSEAFERFYSRYPKPTKPGQAIRTWTKLGLDAREDRVMLWLRYSLFAWERDETEERYIPHPSSWLNDTGGEEGREFDRDPPQIEAPCAQCSKLSKLDDLGTCGEDLCRALKSTAEQPSNLIPLGSAEKGERP